MSLQRETPSLIERLSKERTDLSKIKVERKQCSLSYQKYCCKGKGLVLNNKGMFATAELCSCVARCDVCKGQMRFLNDGFMKSCVMPTPQQLCHLINSAMIPSRYTFSELSDFANKTGNCVGIVNQIKNWEKHSPMPNRKEYRPAIIDSSRQFRFSNNIPPACPENKPKNIF